MDAVLEAPPWEAEDAHGLQDAGGARLTVPEAEEALIGHLLVKPASMAALADAGGPAIADLFSAPLLREIFRTMSRLDADELTFSLKTVLSNLNMTGQEPVSEGVTLSEYLVDLMGHIPPGFDPVGAVEAMGDAADAYARRLADDEAHREPFVSKMGLRMWVDQNDPADHPYEYIIEDLIPQNEGALLIGETQTGKSFLTMHMSMCLARGVPFFGRKILKPHGVIWCAYEAARGQTARMRAYRKHHGLDLEDLPFAVLTRPDTLWPDPNAAGKLIAELKAIAETRFRGVPLGLVVFDTYNAATPGASEIDSETVSKIRLIFDRVRAELGCSTLVVGHTNATTGKHRGNEQLTNNIDTVIVVTRKTKPGTNREKIQLKDENKRDVRTMRVVKQREGQDGEENDFVLHVVEDGTTNAFGRPCTSCVVDIPYFSGLNDGDTPSGVGKRAAGGVKVPASAVMFMRCLIKALNEHGETPPARLGLPRSVNRVVNYDIVKRIYRDQKLADGKVENPEEAARQDLKRSRERLDYLQVIGSHNPFIWLTGKAVDGVDMPNREAPTFFDPLANDDPEDF